MPRFAPSALFETPFAHLGVRQSFWQKSCTAARSQAALVSVASMMWLIMVLRTGAQPSFFHPYAVSQPAAR